MKLKNIFKKVKHFVFGSSLFLSIANILWICLSIYCLFTNQVGFALIYAICFLLNVLATIDRENRARRKREERERKYLQENENNL